jgi:rhodanese-related sulfurtransferase
MGATNFLLGELRSRIGAPRNEESYVICRSTQRAYYATRILVQNGYQTRYISGGLLSRTMLKTR